MYTVLRNRNYFLLWIGGLNYWRDWLEGLVTVKENSPLRVLFLVIAVAALADGVINALFVIFPAAALHLGSTQYGEMLTALGVGSLTGSFLVGLFAQKISPARVIWGGLLGKGLTYLLVSSDSAHFHLVWHTNRRLADKYSNSNPDYHRGASARARFRSIWRDYRPLSFDWNRAWQCAGGSIADHARA